MEKPKVHILIEELLTDAVEHLISANSGQFVSALMIHIDMESGDASVYDDNENLLEKKTIFDWDERTEKGPRLSRQAVHFSRVVLAAFKTRKTFDNPIFMRPFKAIIVDDDFNEIENVLTLEGGDVQPEGRLMKNLEQELQNFSKKIFADLE